MPTASTNFGLLSPLVNNSTDQDLWGGYLDQNIANDDSLILTAMVNKTVAETANFSVLGRTVGTATTGNLRTLFLCNCTGGAITASLPAANAVDNGFIVAFKKQDASGNALTIAANGADTVEGASTLVVSAQYDSFVLVCDGVANWNVMSYKHGVSNALLIPNNLSDVASPSTALANIGGLGTSAFTGSNQSLVSSGYQKIPGGLIHQWGTGSTSGGNPATVTFPITFPGSCFSIVATVSGVSDGKRSVGIGSFSSSSATVYTGEGSSGNEPFSFNWVAYGN